MYISWDAPIPDVTSITAVRDYVLDLHNKMIAVGFTQTTHLNQFDFVAEPDQPNDTSTSINKTYKPLIYTINDSLVPTFVKITFGKCNSGSSALNRQRMFSIVEIGVSINIDGTFTNLPSVRYFNTSSTIGTTTTYISKSGNSHIGMFGNKTAFTLIATPGYSYTNSSSNAGALCLISFERTSDVLTVLSNNNTAFASFQTGAPATIQHVVSSISKMQYDYTNVQFNTLVQSFTTASQIYPVVIYHQGGRIAKSKVIHAYSQVAPLPIAAMNTVTENGKTLLAIGNAMLRYFPVGSSDAFYAYCMEDTNET